jgi:hypothetical protein
MRKYRQLYATALPESTTFKIGKVPGDIRDWQILGVCGATCNNGWMRRLVEDPARPIASGLIAGNSVLLTPEKQRKIAAWASLKVMVAEYGIGEHVTTHHTQRKRMMRQQLPPERGWGVWIGAYKRISWPNFWSSTPFLVLPDDRAAARPDRVATFYNGQASTLAIGELSIVVIRSPKEDLPRRFVFHPPNNGKLDAIEGLVEEAQEGAFDIRRCGAAYGCEIIHEIVQHRLSRSDFQKLVGEAAKLDTSTSSEKYLQEAARAFWKALAAG